MSYLNLIALVDDPQDIISILVARGFMRLTTPERAGNPYGVETAQLGLEYVEIPNAIITQAADLEADPPVQEERDARRVYMLKLAHDARDGDMNDATPEDDDPLREWKRSTLVSWFLDLATPQTESDGTRTYAYEGVYLVRPEDQGRFGVWQ